MCCWCRAQDYDSAIARKLLLNLRAKLGAEVKINIDLVPAIARGRNGKFRTVVSRVKHLYPDLM